MVPLRCRELEAGRGTPNSLGAVVGSAATQLGAYPDRLRGTACGWLWFIEGDLRWFHRSGRLHCMFGRTVGPG